MNYIESMFTVSGKIAVVTGGQGHLGAEYVKTLANAGCKVAVFDITPKINPVVAELVTAGLPVLNLTVDITNRSAVSAAFDEIGKKFGDVATILVNNAGLNTHPNAPIAESGPFENYPEDAWDMMLDSHLKGALFVSQVFIEKYRAAKKTNGSIINVSSSYGVVAPDQATYEFRRQAGEQYFKPVGYSVAKSGMLNFTRWLAEYCSFEKLGIRVNTLVPGGVFAGQDPSFVKEYAKRTMLGRMAESHEYNGTLVFLASDASSYMTGATLVVDGGWTAR